MTSPTQPTPTVTPPLDRVIRGGGWNYDDPAGVHAADRYWFAPANRYYNLGFRCAQRGSRMTLKVQP